MPTYYSKVPGATEIIDNRKKETEKRKEKTAIERENGAVCDETRRDKTKQRKQEGGKREQKELMYNFLFIYLLPSNFKATTLWTETTTTQQGVGVVEHDEMRAEKRE